MTSILSKVELTDDDRLEGWALDPQAPARPARIEISVDGRPFASLLAADLIDVRLMALDRAHLSPALTERLARGPMLAAGFSYRVPTSVPRGKAHLIEVSVPASGNRQPIFSAQTTLAEGTIEALKGLFADFRFLAIEAVDWPGGDTVKLRGWCSTPTDDGQGTSLAVNDVVVPTTAERLASPPDPNHFTFWPDRPTFGFGGVADLSEISPGERGYRIVGVDEAGRRSFPASQDYYLPPYWRECLEEWPVAPLLSLSRTTPWAARRADAEGETFVKAGYLFSGYTDVWHIDDVLTSLAGRSVRDMRRILDWGSGCGRLTQHLTRLDGCEAVGADIDPDNVAWSREHIPGATFANLSLDPPTLFADDEFDLVVGLSVFTHLTEADQFAWLAELRRILKPGGVLAVSVAGHNALKRAGLRVALSFYRETRERGFSDLAIGNKFEDIVGERPTYYRNTRHLADYVTREWSRFFDIRGVAPGAMAGQQDLVIGIKR